MSNYTPTNQYFRLLYTILRYYITRDLLSKPTDVMLLLIIQPLYFYHLRKRLTSFRIGVRATIATYSHHFQNIVVTCRIVIVTILLLHYSDIIAYMVGFDFILFYLGFFSQILWPHPPFSIIHCQPHCTSPLIQLPNVIPVNTFLC